MNEIKTHTPECYINIGILKQLNDNNNNSAVFINDNSTLKITNLDRLIFSPKMVNFTN